MRAHKSAVFALVAFTLAALPAGAQDAKPVEVTPYVALGSAAASPIGAAVTFPVTTTLSVETDVAYRRGEGAIHALSSNTSLLWSLPRAGQSTPYVAAGVVLAQYGAPVFSSGGPPIGTQPRVAMSVVYIDKRNLCIAALRAAHAPGVTTSKTRRLLTMDSAPTH